MSNGTKRIMTSEQEGKTKRLKWPSKATILKWLPWLLLLAVLGVGIPMFVNLTRLIQEEREMGWGHPRLGGNVVRYEPREPARGEMRNLSSLVYDDKFNSQLSIDMGGGRIGRIWCHIKWTEGGIELTPNLLNASAVELFRAHSLDPNAPILGRIDGDKLTLSGVWSELASEPLYLLPQRRVAGE